MSSVIRPQDASHDSVFSPVPDPWNMQAEAKATPRPNKTPLDPSYELTDVSDRAAMMPEGIPEALRLPKHKGPVRSAIAILLEDELKLADQMDEHLRDDVCDAIAFLELASM
ncbi:MAG: hypothetical protein F6J95_030350 [Leptolyngbya sp. SIO1E4]|nr:hypothetical protein [Leptolyngbya sp. SIO1E4]